MKLFVSLGLLLLAYATLDSKVLLSKLAKFSLSDICFLSLLYFSGQLISARKWHLFLSKYREISFLEVSRAYFLGMFLNVVGLGTLGGDIVRSVSVSKQALGKRKSILVVASDRIHGLGVLLFIGVLGGLSPFVLSTAPRLFLFSLMPLLGLLLACGIAGASFSLPQTANKLLNKLQAAFSFAVDTLCGDFRLFFGVTLLSLCVHALQIGMYYCILARLGFELPLLAVVAVVPVVNFFSSLPLSISGVGVREASLILLLAAFGVSAENAALAGFVWFAAASIASVLPYPLMYPFTAKQLVEGEANSEELSSHVEIANS